MTKFKAGDQVRYKTGLGGSFADWEGLEGTVTGYEFAHVAVTVTKPSAKVGRVGDEFALIEANLELLTEQEAAFEVGDIVTFCMEEFKPWQGGKGIVRSIDPSPWSAYKTTYQVEVTEVPPANGSIRVGHTTGLFAEWLQKVEEEPVTPEFPREATLEEIQVGDTVRVTFEERDYYGASVDNYITARHTVVREAVVEGILGWEGKLIAGEGYTINAPIRGNVAKYEILARTEPEPKHWAYAKPVGACALEQDGGRFIQKASPDVWVVRYVSPDETVTFSNAEVERIGLNEDRFLWANVN